MINNRNFQKIFENNLNLIEKNEKKPTLLLHVCCGPCFTIPYERLKEYFEITLMFNNSNIYPKEEYTRRLDELKNYLSEVAPSIKLIITDYNNNKYNESLEPFALDKEGHERCRICFNKRLSEGYKYANEHGFDYYGTVMTISRYKNAQDINIIGEKLQELYPTTKWLYADFKKHNGYEDSLLIIKKHKMYLQEYCGCKYSYEAYKNKPKNAKIDL